MLGSWMTARSKLAVRSSVRLSRRAFTPVRCVLTFIAPTESLSETVLRLCYRFKAVPVGDVVVVREYHGEVGFTSSAGRQIRQT